MRSIRYRGKGCGQKSGFEMTEECVGKNEAGLDVKHAPRLCIIGFWMLLF
jgi:hypothetical protein